MPANSKIPAKGQTTVPRAVRAALNSKPGAHPLRQGGPQRSGRTQWMVNLFTLDRRFVRGTPGRLAAKDRVKMQSAMRLLLP